MQYNEPVPDLEKKEMDPQNVFPASSLLSQATASPQPFKAPETVTPPLWLTHISYIMLIFLLQLLVLLLYVSTARPNSLSICCIFKDLLM